ncbi:MAG: bifunctional phosphopantothenoylcysteine decarboxylase/phosphopantothenate--cysteine ligase CoaBC [Clostridia bacterium]|nr:bifunctional phosphopantothenoylcysteine decarboxylase/phosphopantothenate--cysteine ligase CoaBC [Clostridia bacterium]
MKKTIILGVSGGIAIYKSCEIVSRFVKLGYDVRVIMTKNATEFVTPLTFETLSNNKVVTTTFEKDREFEVEHISYAKLASAFIIAPATANVIAKLAEGICDDMLTTTVCATKAPVYICPAMNTNMYLNPVTQGNIQKLKDLGYIFIEPTEGRLACGDVGKGKMEEPINIVSIVDKALTPNPDYRDKTILVTAGATEEPIDGVRFITNRSSGKMGMAIAEAVIDRGGKVIVVKGKATATAPKGAEVIEALTTQAMRDAVIDKLPEVDAVIMAAAPSDYKVKNYSPSKIKSETLTLELVKNPDIAKEVGSLKGDKKLVVFAAETDDLLQNAIKKLHSKNGDLMVANDVTMEGAGFNVDTNIATLITSSGAMTCLEKMSKTELAHIILDTLLEV